MLREVKGHCLFRDNEKHRLGLIQYLLDAVGPSLFDAVLGPNVVRVLGQLIHQQLLSRGELHVRQLQRCGLVTIWHHVATKPDNHGQQLQVLNMQAVQLNQTQPLRSNWLSWCWALEERSKRIMFRERERDSLLWEFDFLQVLLCIGIDLHHVASQSQQSPVREERRRDYNNTAVSRHCTEWGSVAGSQCQRAEHGPSFSSQTAADSGSDMDWIWSRFEADLEWMWSGCGVDVERMWSGCGVDVERMWSGCGVDVEWMWNRSEVNVERMWSGCGLDYGHNWAEANCYLGSVHRTKSAQNGHFSSQQYFLPVPNVQRSIKSWDYMTHSVQTLILLWPLLFRALIGFYGNKQHQSHLRGRCCKQSSVKLVMVSRIFHKSNK